MIRFNIKSNKIYHSKLVRDDTKNDDPLDKVAILTVIAHYGHSNSAFDSYSSNFGANFYNFSEGDPSI